MRDDIHNGIAGMTAAQSRVLRRAKKLRVLRLLSIDPTQAAAHDPSLEQARQAMREWGALMVPPLRPSRRPE